MVIFTKTVQTSGAQLVGISKMRLLCSCEGVSTGVGTWFGLAPIKFFFSIQQVKINPLALFYRSDIGGGEHRYYKILEGTGPQ